MDQPSPSVLLCAGVHVPGRPPGQGAPQGPQPGLLLRYAQQGVAQASAGGAEAGGQGRGEWGGRGRVGRAGRPRRWWGCRSLLPLRPQTTYRQEAGRCMHIWHLCCWAAMPSHVHPGLRTVKSLAAACLEPRPAPHQSPLHIRHLFSPCTLCPAVQLCGGDTAAAGGAEGRDLRLLPRAARAGHGEWLSGSNRRMLFRASNPICNFWVNALQAF